MGNKVNKKKILKRERLKRQRIQLRKNLEKRCVKGRLNIFFIHNTNIMDTKVYRYLFFNIQDNV